MNLADNLATSARQYPDRIAVEFRERSITYAELDADAGRVAASLTHFGVEIGDRVALWLPNHPAFVSALYGAWRVGAIVVPVNAALTEAEAAYLIGDSGAQILVVSQPRYGEISTSLRSSLDHVIVLGADPAPGDMSFGEMLQAGSGDDEQVELPPDQLALIAYTSGSSGLPKGAMLTHGNLEANLAQMQQTSAAMRAGDVTLCVVPLFHILGLNVLLNLSIRTGATAVLVERFDPAGTLRTIREHGVTIVACAPAVFVDWLRLADADTAAFSGVRLAFSGAASLGATTMSAFRERFGVTIWEGYGLTETSPVLTTTAVGGVAKPGSIGRALPGVDLRLVDDDGEDAEEGDPGEIVVRGPNVFRGYWQQPEETARVLEGGWFRTEDVAIADTDGDLFLVDRKRDVIIVSGFNVYPKEVEDVLIRHRSVDDCAVVGVPDTRSGEAVKAFVVVSGDLTEEDLGAHCAARLAAFKVPQTVEFVRAIPRNAAGKVLRRVLR